MLPKVKNINDISEKLITLFYSGSLQYSLESAEVENFTWDEQKKFLDATISSNVFKKYPGSNAYSRLFFKKLINLLESKQEVHDGFYTHLCLLMKNNSDDDEFAYRHYYFGNGYDNLVIIKETNKMVVNGTTGMKTWQASLILCDWLLSNKDIFIRKNILELGSGIGFTGISVTKFCHINSIVMTDCHTDVLKTICNNIEINFNNIEKKQGIRSTSYNLNNSVNLDVILLDWNYMEDLPNNLVPDIILGADIVYDPSLLEPLCKVFRLFLNRNCNLEIYIANIIRNESTWAKFLETLDTFNMTWEAMPHEECIFIQWDREIQNTLLKIVNK